MISSSSAILLATTIVSASISTTESFSLQQLQASCSTPFTRLRVSAATDDILIEEEEEEEEETSTSTFNHDIAQQFTIKVCTSTSCTNKLKQAGIQDEFFTLGEVYAQAQHAKLERCLVIEDSGCQGNCRAGPCVSILHEDYDGNIGLEGMNTNEQFQRVFMNVVTSEDAGRVWSCVENAITQMTEEANNEDIE